jgi:hypothetical protein
MLATSIQDKLWTSYLNQTYRIANKTFGPTKIIQPTNLNGFIISAWSPNGNPTSYKKNQELSWDLEKELKGKKFKYERVIQVEKTRAWVEDAFLIHNITVNQARRLALKFQQRAFIRLLGNEATVYETISSNRRKAEIGPISRPLSCPAKAEGVESNEFCRQHGFWTTGQALAALGIWRDNLTIVNSRLGCNLCNNVTTHPNQFVKLANPEHLNNIVVTNRFSIAQWVRLKDENAN